MADDKMILVDMGKQKSKHVKDLREGCGALAEEIHGAIAELRGKGEMKPDAEIVVVVVERKPKSKSKLKSLFD